MIRLSFGFSTSQNYRIALITAEAAGNFSSTGTEKTVHHLCEYDFADITEAMKLWALVRGWKGASFSIDGKEFDRGGIGKLRVVYECWMKGKDLPEPEAYCRRPQMRRHQAEDEIQRALTCCRQARILRGGFSWLEHGYVTLNGTWAIDRGWIRGQATNELARTGAEDCPLFDREALEQALLSIPAEFDASWLLKEPEGIVVRPPGTADDCQVLEFKHRGE